MEPLRIGVLAVQGNFREHAAMLRRLGADVVEIRKAEQLDGLDGLVIPSGESTAFMRLMRLYGLETVTIRYFNVFGPRQDPSLPYSGVISLFAMRMLGTTPAGDAYTAAELGRMLTEAGFSGTDARRLAPAPQTLIVATRRDD